MYPDFSETPTITAQRVKFHFLKNSLSKLFQKLRRQKAKLLIFVVKRHITTDSSSKIPLIIEEWHFGTMLKPCGWRKTHPTAGLQKKWKFQRQLFPA